MINYQIRVGDKFKLPVHFHHGESVWEIIINKNNRIVARCIESPSAWKVRSISNNVDYFYSHPEFELISKSIHFQSLYHKLISV